MLILLIVCLCLSIGLHAEHVDTSLNSTSTDTALESSSISSADAITSAPPIFDENEVLYNISASCMSSEDYELLAGNIVKDFYAQFLAHDFVEESLFSMGKTELRATLNFGPLRPWKRFNKTEPSEGELASAPTIEAYYDLVEPITERGSLDSISLLEKNLPPAIAYLDKRFPSIRSMFRRRFQKVYLEVAEELDRKAVDRFIDELRDVWVKLEDAAEHLLSSNDDCTQKKLRAQKYYAFKTLRDA